MTSGEEEILKELLRFDRLTWVGSVEGPGIGNPETKTPEVRKYTSRILVSETSVHRTQDSYRGDNELLTH